MSEVRALIERLVEAGIDPVEAAEIVTRAAITGVREAGRSSGAVRQQRYRERNKASQSVTDNACDETGPLPSKEGPHTPKETQPTRTPIPPKGAPFPKADTAAALQAYSEMAAASGLALPRAMTAGRRARLDAVLREHGLATWAEAVGKVGASSFCRGDNDRGWKADLDFLLQAKSFTKILEGHYDDRPKARGSPPPFGIDAFLGAVIDQQERNHERPDAEIEGYPPPARLLR